MCAGRDSKTGYITVVHYDHGPAPAYSRGTRAPVHYDNHGPAPAYGRLHDGCWCTGASAWSQMCDLHHHGKGGFRGKCEQGMAAGHSDQGE